MYEVLLDDNTIYYPSNKDFAIHSTDLDFDIGLAGEFKFSVPVSNPLYENVGHGCIITILRDNEEYWRGEIKEVKVALDKTKSVYCLEDLSWLSDEFPLPVSITEDTYEQRFQAMIDLYNTNRPADRQFLVGYLTNVTTSAKCKWNTQYDWSILDCLRNLICKDTGYIRVRRVRTGNTVNRYIDIVRLQDYGVQAEQPIVFGVNLLDYLKKMDMGNFTNAITPYGAELEEELYTDYNQRVVGTPIEDATSIARYGRHAKAVIFDGVTDLTQLNGLAQAYLTRYSQPQITMEIKALDLAEISNNAHYEIGDQIHIIAEPYDIDQWIFLTKRNIDLQDVSKNNITLSGHITRGSTLTQQSVQTADTVKDLPSKASILDAAKRNALQMLLDETQGGYVVYEYHENADGKADYIEAINICDEPTIAASTKRWRWSANGLGYMYRDTPNDNWQGPSVAMTADGKINASRILTGDLDADTVRVHGRIEATSGYIGDSAQGWDIGTRDIHNGVTSMDDNAHEGTYIGVDGIRFNQKPTDPTPLAYTKITRLGVDSQVSMTASGFFTKYGKAYLSHNDVAAINHGVLDSDGNLYTGKSTGAFSVKVYHDGEEKYIGLNFMNGILIGASNV